MSLNSKEFQPGMMWLLSSYLLDAWAGVPQVQDHPEEKKIYFSSKLPHSLK